MICVFLKLVPLWLISLQHLWKFVLQIFVGGSRSIVVVCWTAGQQIEQSILVHNPYQNSSHLPRSPPAHYSFTVQNCGLQYLSFHFNVLDIWWPAYDFNVRNLGFFFQVSSCNSSICIIMLYMDALVGQFFKIFAYMLQLRFTPKWSSHGVNIHQRTKQFSDLM